MKRVLIIDDESHARDYLGSLLETHCPEIQVIGQANGVQSGYEAIESLQPDAIFIDISMKDGTGFDLLDRFEYYPFQVIFQTAYDEFAVKAFKYSAIDYLLKPIDVEDLKKAVTKLTRDEISNLLKKQLNTVLQANRQKILDRIVLNSSEGMHFVEVVDIIRLQSEASYTTFYLESGERIVVSKTIKTFESMLPHHSFFRPHQSHIVHLKSVQKFLREDGGYALMKDGAKVPIARSKKDKFIQILTQ